MMTDILKLLSAAAVWYVTYKATRYLVKAVWRTYIYFVYDDDIHRLSSLVRYLLGGRSVVIHALLGLFVAVRYLQAIW